jgi:hypothetical protein
MWDLADIAQFCVDGEAVHNGCVRPSKHASLGKHAARCLSRSKRSLVRRASAFWLALGFALTGALAPSIAEASQRGRRSVPDIRNPRSVKRAATTKRATIRIPVTLHIATARGEQIMSHRKVARWVRRANIELKPYGIEVEVVEVRHLPPGYRSITRRQHRRSLAQFAGLDGTVHLFVTESLDLAYRPASRRRVRGLHWRYWGLRRDLKRREYLVVTRDAPDTTLAHEVGHLLGLRHSFADDNIMCSCREGPSMFTAEQGRQMRSGAESLRARQRTARSLADRRR